MSGGGISSALRERVAQRAGFKCEYCKVKEKYTFVSYQIDHIISKKHGGGNEFDNLAYACPHCNQHKGTDLVTFLDSYEDIVPLFNPRKQDWLDHFEALEGEIIAKSEVAQATIKLLRLNDPERLLIRQLLQAVNEYP